MTQMGLIKVGKQNHLENLDKYLEKTGGDKVKDVSGNFSVSFRFLKDQNKTRINFNSSSLKQEVTHIYSSKQSMVPKLVLKIMLKLGVVLPLKIGTLQNWLRLDRLAREMHGLPGVYV